MRFLPLFFHSQCRSFAIGITLYVRWHVTAQPSARLLHTLCRAQQAALCTTACNGAPHVNGATCYVPVSSRKWVSGDGTNKQKNEYCQKNCFVK